MQHAMKAYGRGGHNGLRIVRSIEYILVDTVKFGQIFSQRHCPIHRGQDDTWVPGVVNCGEGKPYRSRNSNSGFQV
jgi:hypothetical protein